MTGQQSAATYRAIHRTIRKESARSSAISEGISPSTLFRALKRLKEAPVPIGLIDSLKGLCHQDDWTMVDFVVRDIAISRRLTLEQLRQGLSEFVPLPVVAQAMALTTNELNALTVAGKIDSTHFLSALSDTLAQPNQFTLQSNLYRD